MLPDALLCDDRGTLCHIAGSNLMGKTNKPFEKAPTRLHHFESKLSPCMPHNCANQNIVWPQNIVYKGPYDILIWLCLHIEKEMIVLRVHNWCATRMIPRGMVSKRKAPYTTGRFSCIDRWGRLFLSRFSIVQQLPAWCEAAECALDSVTSISAGADSPSVSIWKVLSKVSNVICLGKPRGWKNSFL